MTTRTNGLCQIPDTVLDPHFAHRVYLFLSADGNMRVCSYCHAFYHRGGQTEVYCYIAVDTDAAGGVRGKTMKLMG